MTADEMKAYDITFVGNLEASSVVENRAAFKETVPPKNVGRPT